MASKNISRRDFLKLLALGSLSFTSAPGLQSIKQSHSSDSRSHPNILLIVFDALTARDMSLYGYPRPTTPNLERFASSATVYNHHYSAGSFTSPGTASLLTGVMPWTHRAINLQGLAAGPFSNQNIFNFLPDSYHTYAYTHNSLAYILLDQFRDHIDDLLKISDLAVYSDLLTDHLPLDEFNVPLEAELLALKNSFAVNSSLFLSSIDRVQRKYFSNRANNKFLKQFPRGLPNCRLGDPDNSLCFTLENAVDWLTVQAVNRPNPYFGYLHFFPPHAPYNSRKEFIGIFEDKLDIPPKPDHHFSDAKDQRSLVRLRRRYNETIAYVDSEFGRLLDALKAANILENTCLIVTSDHGEILERGISGHNTPVLYEPLIHIPLIISYPGQNQRIDINEPTHAIDIVPTLLNLAGAPQPPSIEGRFLPTTEEPSSEPQDIFVMEAKSSPKHGPLRQGTFALIRSEYKMIYYHGYKDFDEVFEVYNLDQDPEETQNIYTLEDPISNGLKAALLSKITPYLQ